MGDPGDLLATHYGRRCDGTEHGLKTPSPEAKHDPKRSGG